MWIENPFKTWWKARKYFKFPKIVPFIGSIKKYTPYFCPTPSKILTIYISDLHWKLKWNSPRYEEHPYIWICLFKKLAFGVKFKIYSKNEFGEKESRDLEYWEYLLNYLYYTHSLKLEDIWYSYSKIFTTSKGTIKNKDGKYSMQVPIHTHLFSLNKRGLKEFKKLYNDNTK